MKIKDNQANEEVTLTEFADRWEACMSKSAEAHKSWLYYNALSAIAALRACDKESQDG